MIKLWNYESHCILIIKRLIRGHFINCQHYLEDLDTDIKRVKISPGWVAQLVGVLSHTPKGWGFNSGQDTYLGCGFDPQLGHVREATNQCLSLTLMLSTPLSLKLINISLGEDFRKYALKKNQSKNSDSLGKWIPQWGQM